MKANGGAMLGLLVFVLLVAVGVGLVMGVIPIEWKDQLAAAIHIPGY